MSSFIVNPYGNSFPGRPSDEEDFSRFTSGLGAQRSLGYRMAGDAIVNAARVKGAETAWELAEQQRLQAKKQQGAANRGGIFGSIGRLAGTALSFIPGVGPLIGGAVSAGSRLFG